MKKAPYEMLSELTQGIASQKDTIIRRALIRAMKGEDPAAEMSALRSFQRLEAGMLQDAIDTYRQLGAMALFKDDQDEQPAPHILP